MATDSVVNEDLGYNQESFEPTHREVNGHPLVHTPGTPPWDGNGSYYVQNSGRYLVQAQLAIRFYLPQGTHEALSAIFRNGTLVAQQSHTRDQRYAQVSRILDLVTGDYLCYGCKVTGGNAETLAGGTDILSATRFSITPIPV